MGYRRGQWFWTTNGKSQVVIDFLTRSGADAAREGIRTLSHYKNNDRTPPTHTHTHTTPCRNFLDPRMGTTNVLL